MKVTGSKNEVECTFCNDTGASASIISKETAKSCNLKIMPDETEIILADGSINPVVGKTEQIEVIVLESCVKMKLLIFDNKSSRILLGQDWLALTNAILWPKYNKIMFRSESDLVDDTDLQLEIANEKISNELFLFDHFKTEEID